MPHCTGTDGIIKKIRDTVGDKPVYLSIDVRLLNRVVFRPFPFLKHEADTMDYLNDARLILLTRRLLQPRAHLRRVVGRPVSSVQF